jgi:CRP-like cAMP-binding protein
MCTVFMRNYEWLDRQSPSIPSEPCRNRIAGRHTADGGDEFRAELVGPSATGALPEQSGALLSLSDWRSSSRDHVHKNAAIDSLHLFRLGTQWHFEREPSAGWELLYLLRWADRDTRALAAELLARTEHGRVMKRDLRRAKSRLRRQATNCAATSEDAGPRTVSHVNTPYGMEIVESCLTCKLRKNQWFCGLSPHGLKLVGEASHITTYPGGALLFVEGQEPRGVYVLCSGKAKLSTTSRDGKVLILRIAEPGDVLGLSAGISGLPFEVTAETTEPCQVNFIERQALIERIEKSGELGLRSSLALSKEFQSAYRDIHDLILARSSAVSWRGCCFPGCPPGKHLGNPRRSVSAPA